MIYMSPAFETITGRSVQSLFDEPQTLLKMIHPEDQARVARDRAEDNDSEYRLVRPDASCRWIAARLFPVYNEETFLHQDPGVPVATSGRKETKPRALELPIDNELITF